MAPKSPDPARVLAAVHRKCMTCCGMSRKAVHGCLVVSCDLWPYREPFGPDRQPSVGEQISMWEDDKRREMDA